MLTACSAAPFFYYFFFKRQICTSQERLCHVPISVMGHHREFDKVCGGKGHMQREIHLLSSPPKLQYSQSLRDIWPAWLVVLILPSLTRRQETPAQLSRVRNQLLLSEENRRQSPVIHQDRLLDMSADCGQQMRFGTSISHSLRCM